MIQRIQTIYLALTVIILLTIFFLPVYDISTVNEETVTSVGLRSSVAPANIEATEWENIESARPATILLVAFGLNMLILVMAGAAIFLYKNRPFQARMATIAAALCIVLVGIFFYAEYVAGDMLDANNYKTEYAAGIWMPVLCIVLLLLAARSIRKDEALVRSADRLR